MSPMTSLSYKAQARRTRFAGIEIVKNGTEHMTLYVPNDWKRDGSRRAIISCHAAGGQGWGVFGTGGKEIAELTGSMYMAPDLAGQQTWANQASVDAITAAWTFAKTNYGAATDKLLLTAGSMGSAAAINWAGQNPTHCAGLVFVIPVIDVDDIHDNDRGGYQSEIEAAYGSLAAWNAAEPTLNPVHQAAAIDAAGIPVFMNAGTLDNICLIAITRAFHTAISTATLFEFPLPHFPVFDDNWKQAHVDYLNS